MATQSPKRMCDEDTCRSGPMSKLTMLAALAACCLNAAVFDVTAFGAKGDGKTQNREAINKAIEAAAAAGGGTVEFPAGTWLTGSVRLRSRSEEHTSELQSLRHVGCC